MGPAETLRAAATKLRETARPTLGNDRPWRYAPGKPSDSVRTESGWEVVYGDDPNNLRWIALAHPGLADPLAAWLDKAADSLEHHIPAWERGRRNGNLKDTVEATIEHHYGHAIALARVIQGNDVGGAR